MMQSKSLLLAGAAPSSGFSAFDAVCIKPDADPAGAAAAAPGAGFVAGPGKPDRFTGVAGNLLLSKNASKDVKDLGDITLALCTLTLPAFSQADIDAAWHWMGHTGSKTDGPIGAFVIVEAGQTPHEMAFNRPDKAQVALRAGRLRLISAEKTSAGLRLMYGVATPGLGAKP